jgi:hypothetical protein
VGCVGRGGVWRGVFTRHTAVVTLCVPSAQ